MGPKTISNRIAWYLKNVLQTDMFLWIRHYVVEVRAPQSALLVSRCITNHSPIQTTMSAVLYSSQVYKLVGCIFSRVCVGSYQFCWNFINACGPIPSLIHLLQPLSLQIEHHQGSDNQVPPPPLLLLLLLFNVKITFPLWHTVQHVVMSSLSHLS